MRGKLKYSIIIPTLNEEILLPKLLNRLNDIELRRHNDYEIIISDGGSRDKTLEISNKFADKTILKQDQYPQNIATGRIIDGKSAAGEILIFHRHGKGYASLVQSMKK